MSVNSGSMRDALYEPPGPRTRRLIRVWTGVGILLVVGLLALVVRQFYLRGQFAPRYWSFFARSSTWAFLGSGFLGTLQVSLAAGVPPHER